MKRKPIRALISLLLVLALSTGALAVNPDAMTDIAGHWAREDIRYCLENNLFNGTSATTFTPNDEMTRGMFVTVLGRIAGIGSDTYDTWYVPYIYCDVPRDKYYSPYVSWATRFDIVNGKGDGRFAPDEPITREQMATMISRFTRAYGCGLTQAGTVTARFTDEMAELTESRKEALDQKLREIVSAEERPAVTIVYFVPDEYKDGGMYMEITDTIERVDPHRAVIKTGNGTIIPIDSITDISDSE